MFRICVSLSKTKVKGTWSQIILCEENRLLLGTCAMKSQHSRSWFILNDQNQLKNHYHFEFPLKDHLPVLVLDHNSNFCRGDWNLWVWCCFVQFIRCKVFRFFTWNDYYFKGRPTLCNSIPGKLTLFFTVTTMLCHPQTTSKNCILKDEKQISVLKFRSWSALMQACMSFKITHCHFD